MHFKFSKFGKALGGIVAVALAAGVAGCDGYDLSINGEKGKPLSELDLSGAPPEELALFGPDEVRVTTGDKLAITVEGDPAVKELVRFTLKDGTLGILRQGKSGSGKGVAIIHVTMPAPRELVMGGSGKISAGALANKATVSILGSGSIETTAVSSESLDLDLLGSGNYRAAGNAKSIEMNITGSGSAQLDALRVDKADVSILGSGSAAFASDGEVEADIIGSGNVTVRGRARCKVSAIGSGKLVCENGATNTEAGNAPEPPAPPQPPEPPKP